MKKLRLVIIGCKNMGTKHFKALKEYFNNDIEIVGIMNSSPSSSKEKAQELGTNYFNNLEEITKDIVDIAIVATPASTHKEICINMLSKNIGVFVEKPFATDEKSCKEVIDLARKNNTTLMVGYIEIYNPAVRALVKDLKDKTIKSIKAIRSTMSYASNTDVTIIQNLMSHDISVICALSNKGANDIKNYETFMPDGENICTYANSKILFNNGLEVDLTAKVILEKKVREMDIVLENGDFYKIKFIETELYKNNELIFSGGSSIKEELSDFIESYKTGRTPIVNGETALNVEMISLLLDKDFKKKYEK